MDLINNINLVNKAKIMSEKQPLIEIKGDPVFDNSTNYKQKVKEAKDKLKNQIYVLTALSFAFSAGMFLAFFWVVG
jgi:hypothetical protein